MAGEAPPLVVRRSLFSCRTVAFSRFFPSAWCPPPRRLVARRPRETAAPWTGTGGSGVGTGGFGNFTGTGGSGGQRHGGRDHPHRLRRERHRQVRRLRTGAAATRRGGRQRRRDGRRTREDGLRVAATDPLALHARATRPTRHGSIDRHVGGDHDVRHRSRAADERPARSPAPPTTTSSARRTTRRAASAGSGSATDRAA